MKEGGLFGIIAADDEKVPRSHEIAGQRLSVGIRSYRKAQRRMCGRQQISEMHLMSSREDQLGTGDLHGYPLQQLNSLWESLLSHERPDSGDLFGDGRVETVGRDEPGRRWLP
jgi:hypothetical protein